MHFAPVSAEMKCPCFGNCHEEKLCHVIWIACRAYGHLLCRNQQYVQCLLLEYPLSLQVFVPVFCPY